MPPRGDYGRGRGRARGQGGGQYRPQGPPTQYPSRPPEQRTPPAGSGHGQPQQPEKDNPGASDVQPGGSSRRPSKTGTSGSPVALEVNHFKLGLSLDSVFRYNLSFKPDVYKKPLRRELEQQLVEELGNLSPAYDGRSNLFTARKLPFDEKEFEVSHSDDDMQPKNYKITIKFSAELDSTQLDRFLRAQQSEFPREFLQALDVALRECPARQFVQSGRSFFHHQFGWQPLYGGIGGPIKLKALKGFFQSLRPTMQGLVLNVDTSAAVFYEPVAVIDFLGITPTRGLSGDQRLKAEKLLHNLNVQVTHRKSRVYSVQCLSAAPTKDLTFRRDDGTDVSVVDYFRKRHDCRIKFPELPCLQLGKKTCYVPMELCKICPDQKFSHKLEEGQATRFLSFSCQDPTARTEDIGYVLHEVHGLKRNKFAEEFGITVDCNMSKVEGRILPAPTLKYLNSQRIDPKKGDWNMHGLRFFQPATVKCWAVVDFSHKPRPGQMQDFADKLKRRCCQLGMTMEEPILHVEERIQNFRHAIERVVQKAGSSLELIFCIMEDKNPLYNELKRVCETEIGVVTQCCLKKNLLWERGLSQCLANLAMKINVKADGKNVVLFEDLPRLFPKIFSSTSPTIIFGADVSHPPPKSTSPSLAAVVASMDWPSPTRYVARVRAQRSHEERLMELDEMTRELLEEFHKNRKTLPSNILFFRDGMGEGQFQQVQDQEVSAIYKACATLESNYKPRLTFVVVQKRHHTKFFPTDDKMDNGNVRAGTIVDTVITHPDPSQLDFYLCSHKGMKGTSKPAHYRVLHDEIGFSADELQRLVNNLCYTYARCTKAVSIVPPAYYAHLAAYRARLYIGADDGPGQFPPVHRKIQSKMLYC